MQEQPPKPSAPEKFLRIMGMVMSFVYIVLGMGLYTNAIDLSAFNLTIDDSYRRILGIGFVVYGGYRMYRSLKSGIKY
jgi:hypothetical protein